MSKQAKRLVELYNERKITENALYCALINFLETELIEDIVDVLPKEFLTTFKIELQRIVHLRRAAAIKKAKGEASTTLYYPVPDLVVNKIEAWLKNDRN